MDKVLSFWLDIEQSLQGLGLISSPLTLDQRKAMLDLLQKRLEPTATIQFANVIGVVSVWNGPELIATASSEEWAKMIVKALNASPRLKRA